MSSSIVRRDDNTQDGIGDDSMPHSDVADMVMGTGKQVRLITSGGL